MNEPRFVWIAHPNEEIIAPNGMILELRPPDGVGVIMRFMLQPGEYRSIQVNCPVSDRLKTIDRFVAGLKLKLRADGECYRWANAHNGSESMGAYVEIDWEELDKAIDEFCAEFRNAVPPK